MYPAWGQFLLESESEVLSNSVTPWSLACQVPPSMGFSRQEYWSGLPFPSPGDLPDPGIKPRSPTLQADALISMMRLCNRIWQELPAPSIQGQLQILLGPRQATWREQTDGQNPEAWMSRNLGHYFNNFITIGDVPRPFGDPTILLYILIYYFPK